MAGREDKPADWRAKRRSGMGAIAAGFAGGAVIWFAAYRFAPPIAGAEDFDARMFLAIKCIAVATLFCLVAGVEAVAHQRLQTPAFDPLDGFEDRRLRVNQRYLQNTLEQLVIFAAGLIGLAAYAASEAGMRVVVATTVTWIAGRFAFWIGYHRSAAMRGLGAPGMLVAQAMLLYVAWRVGLDIAGTAGGAALIAAFLALEAFLFWGTRARPAG